MHPVLRLTWLCIESKQFGIENTVLMNMSCSNEFLHVVLWLHLLTLQLPAIFVVVLKRIQHVVVCKFASASPSSNLTAKVHWSKISPAFRGFHKELLASQENFNSLQYLLCNIHGVNVFVEINFINCMQPHQSVEAEGSFLLITVLNQY